LASTISRLFGRSPFLALQNHMQVAVQCARQVPSLIDSLCRGNQEEVAATKDRIFELEEEADKIKNELRAHLPRSLFMPVDRRDLLEILVMQDSIADTAQDIAGLLVERHMEVPPFMAETLKELTQRCVDACEQCSRVIGELDDLVQMGFRGKEADLVTEMIDELNSVEDETDELGQKLARILFSHEDELKPVSVMMWYQLIQWIGDLADYSEKVGDRLRLLIAH